MFRFGWHTGEFSQKTGVYPINVVSGFLQHTKSSMKKFHPFIGLVFILWGAAVAVGQDNCWVAPCDPCGVAKSPFTFGGWVEMGVYTNSHGSKENGPMYTDSNRRTDFLMNQLYFYGEKELNTRRGFDWGARADFAYGVDSGSKQTFGDETFDYNWGTNRHGYGMSAYQLYGTLGYKDLSVKAGKFYTPVGWEGSASKDNFFYSHSYCYWIEPATHMGVLADYNLTDRLTLSAGWTTGTDSSFANPNGNSTALAGFTYSLADNVTVYYWFNGGRQFDLFTEARYNHFVQSLCFEWEMSKRSAYVFQYNLHTDKELGGVKTSTYGINNHFLYRLNDRWGAGMRVEWLRDNADYIFAPGDYYGLTFGLNWDPCKNVSIRPEVRYDWCRGAEATPFADGTKSDQISAGFGVVLSF